MFKHKAPSLKINILRRRATRAVFFIVGFGLAVWAPLVPYAKYRLSLNEWHLGLLMLCLGAGSIITMPLAGVLVGRFSCRAVIIVSGLIMLISIPFLSFAPNPFAMACNLLIFGGAVGASDVAANIQAVNVQRESKRFMMSGFHAFYSIGGLCGAASMSLMLWLGLSTLQSCLAAVALLFTILMLYQAYFLDHTYGDDSNFHIAIPKGVVLILGILCFVTYLSEGIIFDWGALFLTAYKEFGASYAGLGMAVFSLCLALGRIWGGSIIHAMGSGVKVVLWGGVGSAIGLLLAVLVLPGFYALIGYAILGLCVANVVPIIYSAAGEQNIMPVNDAISVVTTLGYAGTLLGPALIGFVAAATSLQAAFCMVAVLMVVLGVCGRFMFAGSNASSE